MAFQLDIILTEEDYLAYNQFHALQSQQGKKAVRKGRIFFITCMVVLTVIYALIVGWSGLTATYVIMLALFTVIYMLFYPKIIMRNIKNSIKRIKKNGKLPFDPLTKLEFHEDKLIKTTADARLEQSYSALERICVVEDRYIYLYTSSINAYIIPLPQLKKQLSQEDLLSFLSQKCSTVEHY